MPDPRQTAMMIRCGGRAAAAALVMSLLAGCGGNGGPTAGTRTAITISGSGDTSGDTGGDTRRRQRGAGR